MDLLIEQLGWCRLQAGDREGALADFERILARYEAEPRRAVEHEWYYLPRALESLPQLRERFEALQQLADALRLTID